MDSQQKSPKKDKRLKNWAIFSGIGLQMGFAVYLGNLLGKWLDEKFDAIFWENTCTLLAIFLSLYAVILQVNRLNK